MRDLGCAVCAAVLQYVPAAIHPGPISIIKTFNTRIWTSGGTSCACSLLEWNIFGEFQAECDISDSGESAHTCARDLTTSVCCFWRTIRICQSLSVCRSADQALALPACSKCIVSVAPRQVLHCCSVKTCDVQWVACMHCVSQAAGAQSSYACSGMASGSFRQLCGVCCWAAADLDRRAQA